MEYKSNILENLRPDYIQLGTALYLDKLTNNVSIGEIQGLTFTSRFMVKSTDSTANQIVLQHSGNGVAIAGIGQESSHGSLQLRLNSGITQVRLSAINSNYIMPSLGIGVTSLSAKLQVDKDNANSSVVISRSGSNLSTSTGVGSITFASHYNSSYTDYAAIQAYSNNLSAVRGSLDLKVKSTSGTLLTGMTLYGTSSGINVGVGITTPNAKFNVYDTFTKTAANPNTVEVFHTGSVSTNNIYPVAGLFTQRVSGSANVYATGLVGVAEKLGDYGYIARGVQGIGKLSGNITVNNADMQYMGVEGRIEMEGSNSVNLDDRAYSFYGTAEIDSGSHLKEYHGLYLNTPTNNGTILNKYGVSQVDANSINYFAGNVGIGTNNPSGKLNVIGSHNGVGIRLSGDGSAGAYYYGFMHDGTNLQGTTQTNLIYTEGTVLANTTISEWASLRIANPNATATGAVITNNYAIKQDSSSQKNFFAGKIGVNANSPIFKVQTNADITGSWLGYLNGTTATFGTNNFSAVHNSTAIGTGTESGINLANNASDDGAPSPIISFSAKSASASYQHAYAAIYGIKTATGADTNWNKGDLVLATGQSTGPLERVRINHLGAVKFNNYGAGILVTDASGNITATTSPPVDGITFNNGATITNQINTDVDTGTETIASVAIATHDSAFFDFVVKKTTNVRSGTVYACHDGTSVVFTETSTNDLGDTSDVTLSVDISGGNMRLLATVTSDDWSVKSLIRAI